MFAVLKYLITLLKNGNISTRAEPDYSQKLRVFNNVQCQDQWDVATKHYITECMFKMCMYH